MKYIPLIIFFITLILISSLASAKYDRHDGSVYSCNTINAERAYALRHNLKAYKKLNAELKRYCRGYQ